MEWALLLLWALLGEAVANIPHYQLTSCTKIPPEWTRHRRAHPDEMVDVSIGLVQNRLPELEERLLQGRHPVSYGISISHTPLQSLTLLIQIMEDISQPKKFCTSYGLCQSRFPRSKPGWMNYNP